MDSHLSGVLDSPFLEAIRRSCALYFRVLHQPVEEKDVRKYPESYFAHREDFFRWITETEIFFSPGSCTPNGITFAPDGECDPRPAHETQRVLEKQGFIVKQK